MPSLVIAAVMVLPNRMNALINLHMIHTSRADRQHAS